MSSTAIKGWNAMTKIMQEKLEELEPNGYMVALRRENLSWDEGLRLAVRFLQKKDTNYCLLMATSIALDAGNKIRGYVSTFDYTMEEYRDYIITKRYGKLSLGRWLKLKWQKKEPKFEEVKEFLDSKTPVPFNMISLPSEGDCEQLQEFLMVYGPIVVSLYVDGTYNTCCTQIIPPAEEYSLETMDQDAGHAVVITGWRKALVGDNYSKFYNADEMTKPQLCWEILDSKHGWGVNKDSRALLPFLSNRLLGKNIVWAVVPSAPPSSAH